MRKQRVKAVVWAMAIIGGFYVLTLFLGFGAAMHVGPETIGGIDKGGNMAAPFWRNIWAADRIRYWAILCWLLSPQSRLPPSSPWLQV